MWSNVTPGTLLEVKYYRVLRFFDDGRVLYSLCYVNPEQMMRMLKVSVHISHEHVL